jgi:hypothetical protein
VKTSTSAEVLLCAARPMTRVLEPDGHRTAIAAQTADVDGGCSRFFAPSDGSTSARIDGPRKGKEAQAVDILKETQRLAAVGSTISWLGWLGSFISVVAGGVLLTTLWMQGATGFQVYTTAVAGFMAPTLTGLAAAAAGNILTILSHYVGLKSRY